MATRQIKERQLLWELRDISKSFPGVLANDKISLNLHTHEIHGLLGENGCGKSTLIKILSGVNQPDSGEMRQFGAAKTLLSPTAARDAGIATVYQEFSLIPQLTVAENIFMGRHPRRWAGLLVDWPKIRSGAEEILSQLDIDIDPMVKVSSLSVAEQQLVEIAKALSQEASLLILDEPTTALGQDEIAILHRLLQRMKRGGVSILYISHRLDEVVELVDCITILKDGKVASKPGDTKLDVNSIVTCMIGTGVAEHYPKERNSRDEVALTVRNLRAMPRVKSASFDLRRGEVLGLGGVIGSGRTEIARALFGADPTEDGEVLLHGKPIQIDSPADAIKAGIALVPENRKYDGLFFNFHAGPNITMANIAGVMRGPLFDSARESQVEGRYIKSLEISTQASSKSVSLISGGNQQKVLIARWLFTDAQVVILDEPTQGIDIGAKLAVYRLINDLTRLGKSVILISSDHKELIAMSDRVAIVQSGCITTTLNASEVTHSHLVSAKATSHHLSAHNDKPTAPIQEITQ